MATSIDGELLKKVSTPLNRLITVGYNPDGGNQWDLVNVGFLQLALAALQAGVDLDFVQVFDTIGVKLVRQNVGLTGLVVLPDLPNYTLKNKERLLLIGQTTATENGFYEWQTGGSLVRLYDWRDVVAGDGIEINANNIALKLWANSLNLLQFNGNGELFLRISPNSHPALKKEAGTGFLLLDPLALGGGGGGGSITDVANPDVDEVKRGNLLAVFAANEVSELNVLGAIFRTATPDPVLIVCDAIANVLSYDIRKHNRINATVEIGNLIGSHLLRVRNNSQYSNFYNDENHAITILGAARIDTVSPRVRRGQTTTILVDGDGFAFLSTFVVPTNANTITFSNFVFINRTQISLDVEVQYAVLSGAYNLMCFNSYAPAPWLGSFSSGTSGNGKLIVFGSPFITSASRNAGLEIEVGTVGGQLTVNGTDLTDDILFLPDGFTINSVSGTSTQKVVNFDSAADVNLRGLKNIYCIDNSTGEDSGTSGDGLIALNFPNSATIRRAGSWRAYGGATLADWQFVGNSIEKIGGSGACYLEMQDIYLNPSYLTNLFGYVFDDFMTFFLQASSLMGDVLIMLHDRGANASIADFYNGVVACGAYVSFNGAGTANVNYRSGNFNTNFGVNIDYRFRIRNNGAFPNSVYAFFETAFGWVTPNGLGSFGVSTHQPKTIHICMTNNFKLNDVYLLGRVGV